MKAYRTVDGGLALFRPDRDASRFAGSARRMAMPVVPADFIDAVQALVDVDWKWVGTAYDNVRAHQSASARHNQIILAHAFRYSTVKAPVATGSNLAIAHGRGSRDEATSNPCPLRAGDTNMEHASERNA
jgi:branched-subunit amino acid aminotransferase/4-amino-4-deoxychorismate lyase